MTDDIITLAHGNGGRLTRELVQEVFAAALADPGLDIESDAVALDAAHGAIAVTTDGFTVQPLEFPGGDIGSLAVHGSVNDLAVAGARPRWLTLGVIIEEGQDVQQLRRIAAGLAGAAAAAAVRVVAGDTKVVPRGQGSGVYLTVTGIGSPQRTGLALAAIRPGDAVLVSGPVGDHGVAVLLARQDFGLRATVTSDSASVLPLAEALWGLAGLRFMRDPTRGGLATVLHEIALGAGVELLVNSPAIPVREAVRTVCDILGYDPLYLACEGRAVAVVAAEEAPAALAAWRALPQGREAAVIGTAARGPARVIAETELGGRRLLPELEGDPLPRIC